MMANIEIEALRRGSLPTDLLACCPAPGRTEAKDRSFRDHLRSAGQAPADAPPREAPAPRPKSSTAESSHKPRLSRSSRSDQTAGSAAPATESRTESTSSAEQDEAASDGQVTDVAAPAEDAQESEAETESQPKGSESEILLAGAAATTAVPLPVESTIPVSVEQSLPAIELREPSAPASIPAVPGARSVPTGDGEPIAVPAAKLAVGQAEAPPVIEETNNEQQDAAPKAAEPPKVQDLEPRAAADILETSTDSASLDQARTEDQGTGDGHGAATAGAASGDAGESTQDGDPPFMGNDQNDHPRPVDQVAAAQAAGSRTADSTAGGAAAQQHGNPAQPANESAASSNAATQDHARQGGELTAPVSRAEDSARPSGAAPSQDQVHGIRGNGESGASRGESTGTARQAGEASPQDRLSEIDRVRLVQRVARAFHTLRDEGGQLRLRLSPPELGALRLDVTVREGVLTAHLEAETPAARAVLLDNLPALRERLAEQQIRIERFDVDLMDRQPGNPSQQTADGRDEGGTRPRTASGARQIQEQRGGETTSQRTMIVGERQLNVVI
jgi:flagellar hook-length control protein FliK